MFPAEREGEVERGRLTLHCVRERTPKHGETERERERARGSERATAPLVVDPSIQ